MNTGRKLSAQIHRNLVAIISLAVAVTSLAYNTWRNEESEHNRNQRLISIEVLRNLGELQQVVYHRHWGKDSEDKGNALTGWAIVLVIHDLAMVLESPLPESAEELRTEWDSHSNDLGGDDNEDVTQIVTAIENLRSDVHSLLNELN